MTATPLSSQEVQAHMDSLSEREITDATQVSEFSGASFDEALRVLRQARGDVQAAIHTLLQEPGGPPAKAEGDEIRELRAIWAKTAPQPREGGEGEEDELARAMRESESAFRATNRSPDPGMQMVLARATTPTAVTAAKSSADDEYAAALRASYEDAAMADETDDAKIGVREDGRPIALRSDSPDLAYAALVIQALFHIPQVRHKLSLLQLPPNATENDSKNYAVWKLVEMFTYLDLAQVSALIDEELLAIWRAVRLTRDVSVEELSKVLLDKIVKVVQAELEAQKLDDRSAARLFHFTYGHVRIPSTGEPEYSTNEGDDGHIVSVSTTPHLAANDLVARLADTLNDLSDGESTHQVIVQPSEVVTFQINFPPAPASSSGGAEPQPLVYPKTMYLDQFLAVNLKLANDTRKAEKQVRREIEETEAERRRITRFEDDDALENLRGAIEFYERVARPKDPGDAERYAGVAKKLGEALGKLEAAVQVFDTKLDELKHELEEIVHNDDLRKHPYDLRAVLVHDGLPGRRHSYSYVHSRGTWWKTTDAEVTEVTEDAVLSDPTGLHLGAGPYMLFYSRRLTEEEESVALSWPAPIVTDVQSNNERFLESQIAKTQIRMDSID